MTARKALALLLVLSLTGSALAFHHERAYGTSPGPVERDQISIQQHATFVEMILQEEDRNRNVREFAAVVGLVKRCKQVDNVFDNAILWFNDQFLFGNKSSSTRNVTPPTAMGANPNRTLTQEELLDSNRNNGTGAYNEETGGYQAEATGTGPNEGGNPDRDGFRRAKDMRERWGGCHIPNGFLHAIPAIDGGLFSENALNQTQELIRLDHDCGGCIFRYQGTYYVTDPNNHRWMIDTFSYSGQWTGRLVGLRETMYTVHLQVDPWNPDRQGFPDEAIWAYREDGRLRAGMPYTEDPNHPCHDDATVAGEQREAPAPGGPGHRADAPEYDKMGHEGGEAQHPPPPPEPAPNPDPDVDSTDWSAYRRGPVGNTVECSIEYNFLLAFSLRDFDRAGRVDHGDGAADDGDQAWQGNSHPHNPRECHRGTGGSGGSGGGQGDGGSGGTDGAGCASGPRHDHNAVSVDLFFDERAPYFTEQNPYWDHANETDTLVTTGTPPIVEEGCQQARNLPPEDYRARAVEERDPVVCDVDAMDGFHLHDGSQTIP